MPRSSIALQRRTHTPGASRPARPVRWSALAIEIGPRCRFEGQPGEQWTMFLRDAAGNALEFKAFADDARLFATD